MARIILHIAERDAWERALAEGRYVVDTLDSEGFIHCSEPHQVVRVADALFRGRQDLLLLAIDTARLASELRREPLEPGSEAFPHVYGALNLDAVTETFPFAPVQDGTFRAPFAELPDDWYDTDDEWYEAIRAWLEPAYLAASTPYGASGFGGDADRWRMARWPIVEAIDRDGTFLDVGCANGLLLESLAAWAAERGHRIQPFGLDISERLAQLARRRVADVHVGNVMTWEPPGRFDYVRTELSYVPRRLRLQLVRRLLDRFVMPGGRLIVCAYGSPSRGRPTEDVATTLAGMGYEVAGRAEALEGGVPVTVAAWLTA